MGLQLKKVQAAFHPTTRLTFASHPPNQAFPHPHQHDLALLHRIQVHSSTLLLPRAKFSHVVLDSCCPDVACFQARVVLVCFIDLEAVDVGHWLERFVLDLILSLLSQLIRLLLELLCVIVVEPELLPDRPRRDVVPILLVEVLFEL